MARRHALLHVIDSITHAPIEAAEAAVMRTETVRAALWAQGGETRRLEQAPPSGRLIRAGEGRTPGGEETAASCNCTQ
jgi:hypothetical protein